MPVLFNAYQIYREPEGVTCAAIQARILARGEPAVIAQKSATTPAVIHAFAQLFFDVVGRLDSPDYILNQVIGLPTGDVGSWDRSRTWKLFGYLGGSNVLDAILANRMPEGASADHVRRFLSEDARSSLRLQVAVAARSLKASNPRTASELAKLSLSLTAKKEAADSVDRNVLEEHIGALMDEIPWLRGDDEPNDLPAEVADWDKRAVELRDEELVLLSAGETVKGLDDWKLLSMPKPQPRQRPAGPIPPQRGP
jgi:hypothetical protein